MHVNERNFQSKEKFERNGSTNLKESEMYFVVKYKTMGDEGRNIPSVFHPRNTLSNPVIPVPFLMFSLEAEKKYYHFRNDKRMALYIHLKINGQL